MDLGAYSLKDLMLTALRAEYDARTIYGKLADGVENYLLKDRLKFLSGEEAKHAQYFEKLFHDTFEGEEMKVPDMTPVPLPEIRFEKGTVHLSEVISRAMDAEIAAYDFYLSMEEHFKEEDDPDARKMLAYIASMELGHYKLLELERDQLRNFEDHLISWPMIHEGP
jgi:rubrerythrin